MTTTTSTPPGRERAVPASQTSWTTVDVDGQPMRMFVARPASPGPHPALLVCQEAFGVNGHIRDVTARFAGQGFAAVAPELYHRTGTGVEGRYDDFPALHPHFSALTTEGMAADLRAAYAWLAGEGDVDITRTAAIGYCMGGRAAFLANSELPLRASVSYYGGGIAQQLLGRVGQLHGPQLMFWGGLDTHIPPSSTARSTTRCWRPGNPTPAAHSARVTTASSATRAARTIRTWPPRRGPSPSRSWREPWGSGGVHLTEGSFTIA